MLGESIFKIREKNNLSQESFAESLGVARNTIQNWESGKSVPDATHLQMISRKYGVSLDEIVCGNNRRTIEERFEKISPTKFTPSSYEANIAVEYEQSMMEGKNIGEYRNLFCEVSKMPLSEYKIKLADTLFEIVMSARQTEDYPYMEPSTYDEICRLCDGYSFQQVELSEDQLEDKIKGAWYGRICGCLLGKPIEGINEKELDILLKETGNYPLQRYIKYADFTDEIINKLQYPVSQCNQGTMRFARNGGRARFVARSCHITICLRPRAARDTTALLAQNLRPEVVGFFCPARKKDAGILSYFKDF